MNLQEDEKMEAVREALKTFQLQVKSGEQIQWNSLHWVARVVELRSVVERLELVSQLFSLFVRHQCRDFELLSLAFRQAYYVTGNELLSLSCLDGLKKVFCTPYSQQNREICEGQDIVWNATIRGNLSLLKLQLRFGLSILTPMVTDDDCMVDMYTLLSSWWTRYGHSHRTIKAADWEKCTKRCFLLKRKPRKRLYLVFRVVEIVFGMKFKSPEQRQLYAECYRLLFEAIPEPYLTSSELRATLYRILPEILRPLKFAIVHQFKSLLPQLAEVPQPRSLKHLSRVEVRQSLRQNLNLPHGVSSLPLPRSLKQYIMLHDDGDCKINSNPPRGEEF